MATLVPQQKHRLSALSSTAVFPASAIFTSRLIWLRKLLTHQEELCHRIERDFDDLHGIATGNSHFVGPV
jgi:hypothetical protein